MTVIVLVLATLAVVGVALEVRNRWRHAGRVVALALAEEREAQLNAEVNAAFADAWMIIHEERISSRPPDQ